MRRIATLAGMTALLLMAPATASAVETVGVAGGVLTYVTDPGQVDAVTVADTGPGQVKFSETMSASGTVGAGCVWVSKDNAATCSGVTALKLDSGDMADWVFVVSTLPATVDAGPGDDNVTGGAGADTLDGGTGGDVVYGGAGNDRIEARDGEADTVDCGAGDDRANADEVDTVRNCETDPVVVVVDDPPAPVAPEPADKKKPKDLDPPKKADPPVDVPRAELPAVVDPVPPASPLALLAGTVQVSSDGVAPFELGCAATELAGCRGDLFLDPAPAGKALGLTDAPGTGKALGHDKDKAKGPKAGKGPKARMARRGRFGRSPFVIAAGKKARLKVSLSPEARRALGLPTAAKKARAARRGRRVKAVVTVVQKGRKAQRSVIELRG